MYELEMPQHKVESLNITRIFFPRDPASRTLYIQLEDENTASQIYRLARNIRNPADNSIEKAKLEQYVPPQLYNRYSALQRYAYSLRSNPANPL